MNLASLYVSKDGGSHWEKTDFLQQQGVNKHIHLVKYSARLKQLFLTDGDNKKQLWRNEGLQKFTQQDSKRLFGWQLLNRFHWQMGGYTSMLNHDEGVMFGTDYLGGTNFMVHTDNGLAFRREVIIPIGGVRSLTWWPEKTVQLLSFGLCCTTALFLANPVC